jgi:hypothetical protein
MQEAGGHILSHSSSHPKSKGLLVVKNDGG